MCPWPPLFSSFFFLSPLSSVLLILLCCVSLSLSLSLLLFSISRVSDTHSISQSVTFVDLTKRSCMNYCQIIWLISHTHIIFANMSCTHWAEPMITKECINWSKCELSTGQWWNSNTVCDSGSSPQALYCTCDKPSHRVWILNGSFCLNRAHPSQGYVPLFCVCVCEGRWSRGWWAFIL